MLGQLGKWKRFKGKTCKCVEFFVISHANKSEAQKKFYF